MARGGLSAAEEKLEAVLQSTPRQGRCTGRSEQTLTHTEHEGAVGKGMMEEGHGEEKKKRGRPPPPPVKRKERAWKPEDLDLDLIVLAAVSVWVLVVGASGRSWRRWW